MSTSAWRGENACRSIPKRAKSKRLAAVAMNSIAQHAVPNGIGHSELALDELTAQSTSCSNLARRKFGLPATSFVSVTCFIKPLKGVSQRRPAETSRKDVAQLRRARP